MRTPRIIALSFVLCFGMLYFHNASAHATPIDYEPEASSLSSSTPKAVRIQFSERIEPSVSNITIFGPDGQDAGNGIPRTDPQDQRLYSTGITDRGEGTYTVSWEVVSADDGHFTKGAFSFSVGKETVAQGGTAGQIQVQHLTSIPEAITIWIELLGQALVIAALMSLVFLWKRLKKKFGAETAGFSAAFEKRFALLIYSGIILIFIGVASYLILKTLDLEQLQNADFPATFRVFIQTTSGAYACYRVVLAFLFAAAFLIAKKAIFNESRKSKGVAVLFALIILILLDRTRVSHAAAAHFHPTLAIFIHAVHLFFKEFWVGAPIAFLVLFMPFLSRAKLSTIKGFAFTQLSKILSVAFVIIGVTGAYIVWLDLKEPANLFTTEWGSRFMLLFIFSGVWLLIRLYHQFVADTYVCRARSNTAAGRRIVSWYPYSLSLEMCIGMTVLLVTSYLIITTPPYASDQFRFEKNSVNQGEHITLAVHPYESKEFLVTVAGADGKSEHSLSNLIVTLTNEEKNIGPLVASVEKRFDGGYVFRGNMLSPAGVWRVGVTAQQSAKYDAIASFSFRYPEDIDGTRVNPDERTVGTFEGILLVNCILIVAFSLLMYRYSSGLNKRVRTGNVDENTSDISATLRPFAGIPAIIAGFACALGIVWFSYTNFVISDFQKKCERDGNFWLQSVPMRNGVALSSDTVTGCTLNVGLNHFADAREYEYFLRPSETAAELRIDPEKPVAGKEIRLAISLYNLENGRKTGPASELTIEHDRIMHVIIIGEDLKTFAHIHAENFGPITPEMLKSAQFPLRYTFPKAGRYTIAVNYYIRAQQFIQQFFVEVAGEPQMEKQKEDLSRDRIFDGYEVLFSAPEHIRAGQLTNLTYTVLKDGKPVTDMAPYLSAAMHLGIIDQNLQGFIHGHGGAYIPGSAAIQGLFQNYVNFHNHFVPDKFGPRIQARVTFPREGLYQIFGEFKHAGKIVTTRFMVKVDAN